MELKVPGTELDGPGQACPCEHVGVTGKTEDQCLANSQSWRSTTIEAVLVTNL